MLKKLCSLLLLMSLPVAVSTAAPDEFSSPLISIGVVVSDLDKSVEFYTEVVGMTRTGGFNVPTKSPRSRG